MPTLQLAGSRTFHLADTLLDQPVAHVVHYQCALAPETSAEAAFEERFQRQLPKPVAADALGQLTREARLAVFTASPQARALVILVEQVEQKPVADHSDQGLRDRLGYLLACGLSEAQVQEQHDRIEAELRALCAPYLVTHADAEQQAIEEARAQQRRVIALCDFVMGVEAPALTTRLAVANALLDLLEPASVLTPEVSSISPQIRHRSFDSLYLLMLQAQLAGRISLLPTPWQKKPNPYLLPLGLFLEHVQAISNQFPA